MIYKIVSELTNSLPIIFKQLQLMGNFIYTNKTIYLDTDLDKSIVLSELKNAISEDEQILVSEINQTNLFQQAENVKYWIKDIWFREEKQRFELEQQEALKQYNKFLDDLENELKKQLIKGGEFVGKQKEN